jgi:hypothetical protein
LNKADPKAINEEVSRLLKKECDSSFKSTERIARFMAFASKTNAPAVGKYTPRYTQVDASFRKTEYLPEKENEGFLKKKELNMRTMHICPHTIRIIEDWAGKKVSPRNHSVIHKNSNELTKDDDDEFPFVKKRTNNSITPVVDSSVAFSSKNPTRSTTNHNRHRSDIARGTLPNKNPFFVRTLANETPVKMDDSNPHSPLATMSPSIIPRSYKKALAKHVSHSLGYNAIYQNDKYHIVHDKGHDNGHEMRIEPNNCDIKPFQKQILKTVGFQQYS